MQNRTIRSAIAALVLLMAPACGQQSEIDSLKSELASVKEDLASLRVTLGRPRPIVDLSGVPQMGNPDGQVALVEFSDYECPFCRRHFRETMPLIESNYISTGKILYAFRDFPIDELHPQAIKAHEAARCGLEQGKFWAMHNTLFGPPEQHSVEGLEATAMRAGLNMDLFGACIASGRTTADIRITANLAARFGANGTPAFFVGLFNKSTNEVTVTQALSGALPFETFAQVLDAAIARATGGNE